MVTVHGDMYTCLQCCKYLILREGESWHHFYYWKLTHITIAECGKCMVSFSLTFFD